HGPLSRAEQAACEHGLRGALPPAAQARTGRIAIAKFRRGAPRIDRLFVLNADRAKTEAALGRGAKKGSKGKKAGAKKGAERKSESGARAKRDAKGSKKGAQGDDSGQGSLF